MAESAKINKSFIMKNKFNHSYKYKKNKFSIKREYINQKSFKRTANLLKEEREKQNLSRYYLSNKTKISINVIEALENGWIHKFPERAYLRKMLRILEKELDLDNNILNNLLPKDSVYRRRKYKSSSFLDTNKVYSRHFSFLIYISLMLISILLLNKYHLSLSKSNVLTVSPLMTNQNGD